MRAIAGLVGVALASLLSGCGPDASERRLPTIEVSAPLPPLPSTFSERAACRPLGAYRPPAVGTRFVYSNAQGLRSEREVVSVTDDVVGFQWRDLEAPDQQLLPVRHALLGMLVVYPDPGGERRLEYGGDFRAGIAGLTVGQTLETPAVETSTLGGKRMRLSFPARVTYRTCGVLQVGSTPLPVRVYDVHTARRVIDRSGREDVRISRVTYLLSETEGYPVALQDAGVSTLVRIDRPLASS